MRASVFFLPRFFLFICHVTFLVFILGRSRTTRIGIYLWQGKNFSPISHQRPPFLSVFPNMFSVHGTLTTIEWIIWIAPARTQLLRWNQICLPAGHLNPKKLCSLYSHLESLIEKYHFPSFWKSLISSTNCTSTLSTITLLSQRTSDQDVR